MAQEIINLGTGDNTGNGDPLRTALSKTQNNFTELYSYHIESSGFEIRSDTTTQPSQTGGVDNPFQVTTSPEGNSDLNLIDGSGNITPSAIGDVLSIDIAFTSIVPAGTNLYVIVKLVVNGIVYRAITQPLVKGLGLDDYFSASWTVPVGSDFFNNGGTIYVSPLTTLLIKDRYIQVTKIHKGI